jgi:hypothetical protein
MDYPKTFTVAEANALIPSLEVAFTEVDRRMGDVQRVAEKLQVLDVLWGARILAKDNPDYTEARGFRSEIADLMAEIEDIVEREILAKGIRVPSGGLEHGLIDFPTTWEGRTVLLCWHRGEPLIEAWHELDAGFAGRQELTLEQVRGMGRDSGAHDSDLPWAG